MRLLHKMNYAIMYFQYAKGYFDLKTTKSTLTKHHTIWLQIDGWSRICTSADPKWKCHLFFGGCLPDDMRVQPHVYSKKLSKWRNKQNRNDSEDEGPFGLSFSSVSLLDFLFLRQVKIMWVILLPIRLEKEVKDRQNKITIANVNMRALWHYWKQKPVSMKNNFHLEKHSSSYLQARSKVMTWAHPPFSLSSASLEIILNYIQVNSLPAPYPDQEVLKELRNVEESLKTGRQRIYEIGSHNLKGLQVILPKKMVTSLQRVTYACSGICGE